MNFFLKKACRFKKRLYLCTRNQQRNNEVDKQKSRCCSSVWLECLPVTQEVASSSLVSTANRSEVSERFFYLFYLTSTKKRDDIRLFDICISY